MYVHVIVAGIGVSFKIYPPPKKKTHKKTHQQKNCIGLKSCMIYMPMGKDSVTLIW